MHGAEVPLQPGAQVLPLCLAGDIECPVVHPVDGRERLLHVQADHGCALTRQGGRLGGALTAGGARDDDDLARRRASGHGSLRRGRGRGLQPEDEGRRKAARVRAVGHTAGICAGREEARDRCAVLVEHARALVDRQPAVGVRDRGDDLDDVVGRID